MAWSIFKDGNLNCLGEICSRMHRNWPHWFPTEGGCGKSKYLRRSRCHSLSRRENVFSLVCFGRRIVLYLLRNEKQDKNTFLNSSNPKIFSIEVSFVQNIRFTCSTPDFWIQSWAASNLLFQHGGTSVSPEMGKFFVCLCFKCYSPAWAETSVQGRKYLVRQTPWIFNVQTR